MAVPEQSDPLKEITTMEYMILIYGDERTFGSLDKVGSVEVRPLDPMTK